MNTQEAHRIDWHKVAGLIRVVVLSAGKAVWWIAKKGGICLVAILTVMAKVFMALVSVWASVPETHTNEEHAPARPHDSEGLDLSTGLPVRKVL